MESIHFLEILKKNEITFFTGIPDSLMKNFLSYLENKKQGIEHYIEANEGSAIGLGIGYHLSTNKLPLIYLQNSGIGNCVNPLLSLADQKVFSIPLVLLIGWRGEKGKKDEPQHIKQGEITEQLLKVLDIPYLILSNRNGKNNITKLIKRAKKQKRPVALLVKKDFFQNEKKSKKFISKYPLTREDVIKIIIENSSQKDIIVATTGMASRELLEIRKNLNANHIPDFLTIGGMGHASQIAFGIAIKNKKKNIICLDGDGSLIMHLGGMAIIGANKPNNLKHVVINNGVHGSVGNQKTVGMKINFPKIAEGCGYKKVVSCSGEKETRRNIKKIIRSDICSFLEVKVNTSYRNNLIRPERSPKTYKDELIKKLTNAK